MRLDEFAKAAAQGGTKFDIQLQGRPRFQVMIQEVADRLLRLNPHIPTMDAGKATNFRTCYLKLSIAHWVLTREIQECKVTPLKKKFAA